MHGVLLAGALLGAGAASAWRVGGAPASVAPSMARDWPAYGGGPAGIRHSPLAQIDRSNVARLAVAWTYDSGEDGGLQANPIIDGRTI